MSKNEMPDNEMPHTAVRRLIGCAVMAACLAVGAAGATPPPNPSFSGVMGWGAIGVTATLPAVQVALSKARVPHAFKVLHKSGQAYITVSGLRDGPGRSGGGWAGTVWFGSGDRVSEVQVRSPSFGAEAAARAELAALTARFGPPAASKPEGPGQRYWEWEWRNERARLRVSISGSKRGDEWVLTQSWTPTVKPAPRGSSGRPVDGSRLNRPVTR